MNGSLQVLISEAKDGKSNKNDKKSGLEAKGKRKSGKSGSLKTLKKNNDEEASESNIEMDSRLLSVLLTVSMLINQRLISSLLFVLLTINQGLKFCFLFSLLCLL